MEKQNFYDLSFDQLKNFLVEEVGVNSKKAKMRAQQLFQSCYKKNIKSFDELTNFSLRYLAMPLHNFELLVPARIFIR